MLHKLLFARRSCNPIELDQLIDRFVTPFRQSHKMLIGQSSIRVLRFYEYRRDLNHAALGKFAEDDPIVPDPLAEPVFPLRTLKRLHVAPLGIVPLLQFVDRAFKTITNFARENTAAAPAPSDQSVDCSTQTWSRSLARDPTLVAGFAFLTLHPPLSTL